MEERSDNSSEDEQDRISAMPNYILLRILSFLGTKEAIKTGTLSRRWQNVWNFLPNLHFICTSCQSYDNTLFLENVESALCGHDKSVLEKLTLHFQYEEAFSSPMHLWLSLMTSFNLKELYLFLDGNRNPYLHYDHYQLPQRFYMNPLITKLSMSFCDIVPKRLISWKSLKCLTIGFTNLSEQVIQMILAGSPLLEFLDIYGFSGFSRLDIDSESLKNLVVRSSWGFLYGGDESDLFISAPYLQSLSILGKMCRKKFWLEDIQSLVECNLNFARVPYLDNVYWRYEEDRANDYEMHRNVLRELLDSLGHLEKLTMGNWCLEVVSVLELKGMLPPIPNCKNLILETVIKKRVVPGIAGLLQSSPNLETLVINMTSLNCLDSLYDSEDDADYWTSEQDDADENFPENYWTSEKASSMRFPLHLETVKIFGFDAQSCHCRLVIQLVQFLLQKAMVLKKMVITNAKRADDMECLSQKLEGAQLFSLPSSSPHLEIMFL